MSLGTDELTEAFSNTLTSPHDLILANFIQPYIVIMTSQQTPGPTENLFKSSLAKKVKCGNASESSMNETNDEESEKAQIDAEDTLNQAVWALSNFVATPQVAIKVAKQSDKIT